MFETLSAHAQSNNHDALRLSHRQRHARNGFTPRNEFMTDSRCLVKLGWNLFIFHGGMLSTEGMKPLIDDERPAVAAHFKRASFNNGGKVIYINPETQSPLCTVLIKRAANFARCSAVFAGKGVSCPRCPQ